MMMSFSWTYQTPDKGWWANYRWHITETCEELGLKPGGWEKVFFRSGWQGKILAVNDISGAKKCLQALSNGTITAFGGRFRGASYDKNTERIIKASQKSLKEAIKKHNQGESISIKETAIVPASYYNQGAIVIIISIIIFIIVIGLLFWAQKKRKKNEMRTIC